MVGGSSIGSSHAIAYIDAILIHYCIFTPVRESAVVWGRGGGGGGGGGLSYARGSKSTLASM